MKRIAKVIYMPTINPRSATDLRFFIPYAANYITEVIANHGFNAGFIDLNKWYWNLDVTYKEIGEEEFVYFIEHNKISKGIRNLIDRIKVDFSVGVEDNVLYLLSKDFFSFELNDRSLLLLITIAKFLKESGKLNIVIIGGSHSKKEFMQRVITNFTCIDYAFYNEIWSKPNYDDLMDCLMDIESNNITERNNLNRRNYFYRSCDGSIQDNNPQPQEIHRGRFINHFPKYEFLNMGYNFSIEDICDKKFLESYPILLKKIIEGILTVKFTNGCVNKCAYCKGSKLPLQIESIAKTIDYMEFLSKEKGFRHLFFLNRELNMTPIYLRRFCREIVKRKLQIRWTDSFDINNLTPDDVALIKEAGCIQVTVGIDTTSQKIGSMVGRQVKLGHMEKIFKLLHEEEIWIRANIIVGFPYQSAEDIEDDIKFLTRNEEFIQHLNISEFKLFPHTLCGDSPNRYGLRIIDTGLQMNKLLQQDNPSQNYFSYKFDETKGRQWEEIVDFTEKSFERLTNIRNTTQDYLAACLPLIFLLYDVFTKKSEVSSFISSYSKYLLAEKRVNILSKKDFLNCKLKQV